MTASIKKVFKLQVRLHTVYFGKEKKKRVEGPIIIHLVP